MICCWRSLLSSVRSTWPAARMTACANAFGASVSRWRFTRAFSPAPCLEAAEQVHISHAEIAHMVCRYSRRAQFLQIGLPRHKVITRRRGRRCTDWPNPKSTRVPRSGRRTREPAHPRSVCCARPHCATTTCMCGPVRCGNRCSAHCDGPPPAPNMPSTLWVLAATGVRKILRRDGPTVRGRALAASRGGAGASQRMGTGNGPNTIGTGGSQLVDRRPRHDRATGRRRPTR